MSINKMLLNSLYEKYHNKSSTQKKVISANNFTYINIIPILNSCLSKNIKSILDIGCGSGTISLYLASKGYKIKGIDISKKAIDASNKSAEIIGLKNADFEVCDFPNKIPSGKYDLIFFSEVIEHLPNDELALQKIYKLLRPGGILFLSTPSKNAPLYKLGYTKKFDREVGHLRRYTAEELQKKLKKNGFKIKKIYKKESMLRNFLFLNPFAGKAIRYIKYFIVDIVTKIDNTLSSITGESQIIIVSKKAVEIK